MMNNVYIFFNMKYDIYHFIHFFAMVIRNIILNLKSRENYIFFINKNNLIINMFLNININLY